MKWLTFFFSNQESRPPALSPLLFLLIFSVLLVLTYTTLRFYENKAYRDWFKVLQIFQMSLLYSWYLFMAFSLKESLPFYHCRMAMFACLFLPDRHPWKRYFVLIGFVGSFLSFVYPIFDHYPLGHVTIFSYLAGHFALYVNCLIYLLRFHEEAFDRRDVMLKTILLNAFLSVVNLATGGNYGFLRVTPLIGHLSAPIRFLAVTLVLTFLVCSLDWFFVTKGESVRDLVGQDF